MPYLAIRKVLIWFGRIEIMLSDCPGQVYGFGFKLPSPSTLRQAQGSGRTTAGHSIVTSLLTKSGLDRSASPEDAVTLIERHRLCG